MSSLAQLRRAAAGRGRSTSSTRNHGEAKKSADARLAQFLDCQMADVKKQPPMRFANLPPGAEQPRVESVRATKSVRGVKKASDSHRSVEGGALPNSGLFSSQGKASLSRSRTALKTVLAEPSKWQARKSPEVKWQQSQQHFQSLLRGSPGNTSRSPREFSVKDSNSRLQFDAKRSVPTAQPVPGHRLSERAGLRKK